MMYANAELKLDELTRYACLAGGVDEARAEHRKRTDKREPRDSDTSGTIDSDTARRLREGYERRNDPDFVITPLLVEEEQDED